ncbi:hypothetical protein FVR03_00435 [Pontibacter qinzhouensis]|uniref:DUF3575 domain-containing protein n=1 Tax=Pontibacter qinzhouensis TaxID=2603253 RepID=A0A5C8KBU7_9BACT|nr:hypothetical protein [Pontibacter qinzhouensis]TXK52876.1 hypothetical protein FVR03_00435 [Pontibacter qinzhouensis]
MKAKLLFTLTIILASFGAVQAQSEQPATVVRSLFKLNFRTPGLEYERRIAELTTVNINPKLNFGIRYHNEIGIRAFLFPSLEVQARKYYNLSKRQEQEKNTAYNSGNFIALSTSGSTASILKNDYSVNQASFSVGPVWGMQRNYNNGFSLTLTLGAGYTKNYLGENRVTPLTGLNLGFLIGRR